MEEPAQNHSVVAKLDVLLEEEPSPTPAVAAVWADVLSEGVLAEDIITYALLRQVKRHMVANETQRGAGAATQVSLGFCRTSVVIRRGFYSDYVPRRPCHHMRALCPRCLHL